MDEKVKRKWIAALHSGKYKQGIKMLRKKRPDGYHYCCLGVLRELTGIKKRTGYELLDFDQALAIGITPEDQDDLAEMNDCGASFDEIANFIKKAL